MQIPEVAKVKWVLFTANKFENKLKMVSFKPFHKWLSGCWYFVFLFTNNSTDVSLGENLISIQKSISPSTWLSSHFHYCLVFWVLLILGGKLMRNSPQPLGGGAGLAFCHLCVRSQFQPFGPALDNAAPPTGFQTRPASVTSRWQREALEGRTDGASWVPSQLWHVFTSS